MSHAPLQELVRKGIPQSVIEEGLRQYFGSTKSLNLVMPPEQGEVEQGDGDGDGGYSYGYGYGGYSSYEETDDGREERLGRQLLDIASRQLGRLQGLQPEVQKYVCSAQGW